MCTLSGSCSYHPSALCLCEEHHANLLLRRYGFILSFHLCGCTSCTFFLVLQRLLVYWDAGLLVSPLSPYFEPAAATAAEYQWVPVHFIELYVSHLHQVRGGLSFNCCNLISIRNVTLDDDVLLRGSDRMYRTVLHRRYCISIRTSFRIVLYVY